MIHGIFRQSFVGVCVCFVLFCFILFYLLTGILLRCDEHAGAGEASKRPHPAGVNQRGAYPTVTFNAFGCFFLSFFLGTLPRKNKPLGGVGARKDK